MYITRIPKELIMWFVACVSIFLAYSTSFAADLMLHLCRQHIPSVIEQFVHKEFPGQIQQFELKAFNEVRCEQTAQLAHGDETHREYIILELDDMVNAAVVVTLSSVQTYHTVAHVHFGADGLFIFSIPDWNLSDSPNAWRQEWCKFIFYFDELKELKGQNICAKDFKPESYTSSNNH